MMKIHSIDNSRDFSGGSVVKTSLSNAGARVQSRVGELRPYMPHGHKTET